MLYAYKILPNMGCISSRARYERIVNDRGDTDVLVEIGKGGHRGRYWFKYELPPSMRVQTPVTTGETDADEGPVVAVASSPTGSLQKQKDHRFFKRSKQALKIAQDIIQEFRDTRYEHWQEVSKDSKFSLFKNSKLNNFIASCTTEGAFAHEVAYEFWNVDPKSKLEWDTSIEKCTVLETVTASCSILHLVTKTIWPLKARDLVMCSEYLRLAHGTYAVCNYSLEDYDSKLVPKDDSCLRATSSVVLIVEQHLKNANGNMDRNNIVSEIYYQANIDPGGWVPVNLVNALSRKEWKATLLSLCKNVHRQIALEKKRALENEREDNDLFFDSQEQSVISF